MYASSNDVDHNCSPNAWIYLELCIATEISNLNISDRIYQEGSIDPNPH